MAPKDELKFDEVDWNAIIAAANTFVDLIGEQEESVRLRAKSNHFGACGEGTDMHAKLRQVVSGSSDASIAQRLVIEKVFFQNFAKSCIATRDHISGTESTVAEIFSRLKIQST